MEQLIRVLEISAWPIVTLVGLVLLGPGGYLMRFADRFGKALSDFTVAMPQLEKTALQMRSSVDTFTTQSQQMSETMSKASAEVEARVSQLASTTLGIASQLNDLSEKTLMISDTVAQIDREKMVETQEHLASTIDQPDGNVEQLNADIDAPVLTSEEMIASIKEEWSRLIDALRERSGNRVAVDKRQIGSVAWALADRRRSHPISHETAGLIQELHSQYKRFIRLINSKEEWLTVELYNTFVSGAHKAVAELDDRY
jgi:Sec-independent protein translocase protein TatA